MKAVVLVGGQGTRLRPLTETVKKELIPLVDRPILSHVLDHLAAHGLEEVVLSSSYLEPTFRAFLDERADRPPAITWITETTPLDTAGAIANAAQKLSETYLVLNGDILTDLDLTAMLAFHRAHGAVATISLGSVEDARPYGLVSVDDGQRVVQFREKPAELIPGLVNSGTYVLEPEALEAVTPGTRVNIEREVFPELIAIGRAVFGYVSPAYWIDTGTPAKYLRATFDLLEGRLAGLAYPAPFVDPTARISLRAHLGRNVVAGSDVTVEDGAEVEDSVLLAGALVESGARITDSIVGPRSVVGAGATVSEAVLAEGSKVPPGTTSSGARVPTGGGLEPG
jgi:mannose-1-phosphate guanylyltransferase